MAKSASGIIHLVVESQDDPGVCVERLVEIALDIDGPQCWMRLRPIGTDGWELVIPAHKPIDGIQLADVLLGTTMLTLPAPELVT